MKSTVTYYEQNNTLIKKTYLETNVNNTHSASVMACTTTFNSILRTKWLATIREQHTFGTREQNVGILDRNT